MNSHGFIKWSDDNGNSYFGGWKDGKQNGQGVFKWSSGSCYVGAWKDHKKNGHGVLK